MPTPLKNMSSSVGMIIPIYYGKINVPNHQPVVLQIHPVRVEKTSFGMGPSKPAAQAHESPACHRT